MFIVKCMLLTFIFNYSARLWRFYVVAIFHVSFLFQSSIPHSFLMYQVDIYVAHTSHSIQTYKHTLKKINLWKEKKKKENIKKSCSSHAHENIRWENSQRVTIVVVVVPFYRKYGRNPWTCVSCEHHRLFWNWEKGKIFWWTSFQFCFKLPSPIIARNFVTASQTFRFSPESIFFFFSTLLISFLLENDNKKKWFLLLFCIKHKIIKLSNWCRCEQWRSRKHS